MAPLLPAKYTHTLTLSHTHTHTHVHALDVLRIRSEIVRDIGLFITLCTCPQCFLITFSVSFGTFYLILIGWFIRVSIYTFQTLILIYSRGNFLFEYYTSIYRSLSYPFRSLKIVLCVFMECLILPNTCGLNAVS